MGWSGGQAVLLTGSYKRALDDKQRLAVPKPLREQLPLGSRLYLTPGLDGCLAAYPEPAFAAMAERLASNSPAAREVRDYSRLFYSQATSVVPDGQWRFRLPAGLSNWAGLEGEVMVVGVRDHLEIWAAERWTRYIAQCDPHYDRLAEMALVASFANPRIDATSPNALAASSNDFEGVRSGGLSHPR
jgi:MraZ protein